MNVRKFMEISQKMFSQTTIGSSLPPLIQISDQGRDHREIEGDQNLNEDDNQSEEQEDEDEEISPSNFLVPQTLHLSCKRLSTERPFLLQIICSSQAGRQLDLLYLSKHLPHSEYDLSHFIALVVRLRSPRSTLLIFRSGKLVCLGCQSEDQAKVSLKTMTLLIKNLGYTVFFRNFQIIQLAIGYQYPSSIDLQKLASMFPDSIFISQKDNLFIKTLVPGAVRNENELIIKTIVRTDGTVIQHGSSSFENCFMTFYSIIPFIRQCQG